MTLAAVWARVAAIDRYLLPAFVLRQTGCTSLLSTDGTDRQTDGVSEQLFDGTSVHYRLFRAIKFEVIKSNESQRG